MFNIKRRCKFNEEECYKHIANNLINISKEEKIKVIGFVSTNIKPDFLIKKVQNIAKKIKKKKVNVAIVNIDFNESSLELKSKMNEIDFMEIKNIFSEDFEKKLLKYQDTYELILVSINSINTKSEAIEYAKVCKEIIIIEKCMECSYLNYENMLLNFKTINIKPRGVITVS